MVTAIRYDVQHYPSEPQATAPLEDCRRYASIFTRSLELEHPLEEVLDCLFGFPGGDRIVASVHAVNDTGVRVAEWLLGIGVYQ